MTWKPYGLGDPSHYVLDNATPRAPVALTRMAVLATACGERGSAAPLMLSGNAAAKEASEFLRLLSGLPTGLNTFPFLRCSGCS